MVFSARAPKRKLRTEGRRQPKPRPAIAYRVPPAPCPRSLCFCACDGLAEFHHLGVELERGTVDRLVPEATHQARRLVEDESRLAVAMLVDGETHRHVEARFDVMLDHGDGDQGIADRVQDKARRPPLP